MNSEIAHLVAVVGVGVAFLGLVYGVTGRDERRRGVGLHILQFGMTVGGLALIGGAILSREGEDAIYGLLLLVFGTGVTAIGRPRSQRQE